MRPSTGDSSFQSIYRRSSVAVSCAFIALGLAAEMPRPTGSIKPFWEPTTATSMPHSSMRKSIDARDEIARHQQCWVACRIHGPANGGQIVGDAAGGLVVNDADGLDLVRGIGSQPLLDPAGINRHVPFGGETRCGAKAVAMRRQPSEKLPVSGISNRSSGDRVFVIAASSRDPSPRRR